MNARTPFATSHSDELRIEELPARRFAVARHEGPIETIQETRRPLYQHLIMHELVGGPPVLRFPDDGDHVEVLVGTTEGFQGDAVCDVEVVPPGWYAVMDYEGPETGLPAAHERLRAWVQERGHTVRGPMLQVHLMDPIDGDTEQQLQLPVEP